MIQKVARYLRILYDAAYNGRYCHARYTLTAMSSPDRVHTIAETGDSKRRRTHKLM